MALAQAAATLAPVATEPVNVTASTLLVLQDRLADHRAAPDHEIEHALGHARAHDDFRKRMGGARHEVSGLEHDCVAIGQSRRDLPGGNGDREVPRRDDADDAERLARHLDVDVGPHAREFLARDPQGFAGEEVEDLPGSSRLANSLWKRLAFLARKQASELLAAGENFGRSAQQDVVALLRRRARPGGKRRMRGLDRGVRLSRVGLCVFADDVIRVRRVDVASDASAVDPFSRDKVLVRAHGFVSLSCRPNFWREAA